MIHIAGSTSPRGRARCHPVASVAPLLALLATAGAAQAQQQTYQLSAHLTPGQNTGLTPGEVLAGTLTYDPSKLQSGPGYDLTQTIAMQLGGTPTFSGSPDIFLSLGGDIVVNFVGTQGLYMEFAASGGTIPATLDSPTQVQVFENATSVYFTVDSFGPAPTTGPMVWTAAWDAAAQYAVGDVVVDASGTTWIASAPNLGVVPGSDSGADWVRLQGPAGATGPQGPAGNPGAAGAQGVAGPTGPQGQTGDPGAAGSPGAAGPTGPAGADGAAGPAGADGAAGPTGATGPSGAQGGPGVNWTGAWSSSTNYFSGDGVTDNGSSYLSLDVNTGSEPSSTNSDWLLIAAAGSPGPAGSNGLAGPAGPTGAIGPPGAAGANGANGANGATGATGATGTNGTNGAVGAKGATGATGAVGAKGATGAMGAVGAKGATGATGATGVAGAKGATGAAGAAGAKGATGPAGPTGAQGASGAGLITGSYLLLDPTVTPPSGYTLKASNAVVGGVTVNVYRKN